MRRCADPVPGPGVLANDTGEGVITEVPAALSRYPCGPSAAAARAIALTSSSIFRSTPCRAASSASVPPGMPLAASHSRTLS